MRLWRFDIEVQIIPWLVTVEYDRDGFDTPPARRRHAPWRASFLLGIPIVLWEKRGRR